MTAKAWGALFGFGFGWAILQYGFFRAVFLAVCVGVGWFVGRVLDGEVSLLEILDRNRV